MNPAIESQLKLQANFPSPPGVAGHIITLAQDPAIELEQVARAVSMDSALTAKILRTANSPLYAQRRKSENLRQALILLGLNATLTLALSFSLVKVLRAGKASGLDLPYYWRRTMLAGTAARALADALRQPLAEEFFLGGLLQDVGMLALNIAFPELYRDSGKLQHDHRAVAEMEKKQLKSDHAEVGAWIMRKWNLPPRICRVIEQSHNTDLSAPVDQSLIMERCVALSGPIADLFLVDSAERPFAEIALLVERSVGLDRSAFSAVLDAIGAIIPETEAMFDAEVLSRHKADRIVEQAREVLTNRTLHTLQEFTTLKAEAENSIQRAIQLEKETQLDQLTGLCNRAYLDFALDRDFGHAVRTRGPLSLAFCDLDNFKKVNDTYGHQAGDRVLESAARLLRANTRDSDTVARYGGEEFVIVLPDTDRETARKICERIVRAFAEMPHELGLMKLPVTVSIGCATHSSDDPFANVAQLVHAADLALYSAKDRGRNQVVPYASGMNQPLARVV
ncbi:MAG: HDOD domain-containing protein [Steroidobacterales bacterium]